MDGWHRSLEVCSEIHGLSNPRSTPSHLLTSPFFRGKLGQPDVVWCHVPATYVVAEAING
jgi:hypothetical protein